MRGIHIRMIHTYLVHPQKCLGSGISQSEESTNTYRMQMMSVTGELHAKQVSSSNDSFVKILPYSCRCKTGVPIPQSAVHDWGSWPPSSTLRPPVLRTSHAWGSCLILGVQAHVAHDHVRRVSRLGAIVRTQHNRDDGRPAVMWSIQTGCNRGNC